MKATYRNLVAIGITFAVLSAPQTSAVVGTNNIVGKVSATNSIVASATYSVVSSMESVSGVTDTNVTKTAESYFNEHFMGEMIQQQADGRFFGVQWMDSVMNTVDFDSSLTFGGVNFGIDTASGPILRVKEGLYFGPFYVSKYPMSSTGPYPDVTDIGFVFRWNIR